MEFAGVAAAAGKQVTVIESSTYPLGPFDKDCVRTLLAAMQDQGIDILTRRQVQAIEKTSSGFMIKTDSGQPTIEVDLVVAAVGRKPSVDKLNLEAGGVEHGKAGIKVDEHLRSVSNPRVFAGGDVADQGRPPLTPIASQDAGVLAHNLWAADDALREHSTSPIASVAFTCPPIASVGLLESEAREQHGDIDIKAGDMSSWKLLREHGHDHGSYKLIFQADDGPLLGAHLVGYGVDEVINLFSLAICQKCSCDDLCKAALAYPTLGFNLHNLLRR
jgi:glutathione reductase (NADPH)